MCDQGQGKPQGLMFEDIISIDRINVLAQVWICVSAFDRFCLPFYLFFCYL